MTIPPDFDELVEQDLPAAERARLRRVHELLVQAGPPPELAPEIESGPTIGVIAQSQSRGHRLQRGALLLAAALALVAAFFGGFVAGNDRGGYDAVRLVRMHGTAAAPDAHASLALAAKDESGNWPMRVTVSGLKELPSGGYYELFLTRGGKAIAPCGAFRVHGGDTVVNLNAPYKLKRFDGWVVTLQRPGHHKPGKVVLRTAQV